MKFRIKITLCMLGLLSALFGAGGSLLIAFSFQTSLDRERDAAYNAYQMILGTLQIVNGVSGQLNDTDITHTLEQLTGQNASRWSSLRLYTETKTIYDYNSAGLPYSAKATLPGRCSIQYMPGSNGGHRLAVSGSLEAGSETLYLDMMRDISSLFDMRRVQQQTYQWVFLLMVGLCALFSYSISRVLTAPLSRLSKASRSIAAGQLSSRAHIHSQDEVGLVACDFNAMADALEQTISQLQAAAERQERFMGSFAHEVKTPMTSIIGYADLIRGQTLNAEEQFQAANYIVSEGKRLENLSQKLLGLLVLKNEQLTFAPVCPSAIIQGLAAHLEPLYNRQGISLICDCQDGVCLLEPDLIKSLLVNLWDNARKAMEESGGTIYIWQEMLPDGCIITVQDSGQGIAPEALVHLTEAFYRVDKSRARAQGGVGLGLSLCKEITTLHNGSIHFESQLGQGTAVTVTLRGGAV